jgi:hypothetical protein
MANRSLVEEKLLLSMSADNYYAQLQAIVDTTPKQDG